MLTCKAKRKPGLFLGFSIHTPLQCPNGQILTEAELIMPNSSHLKLVHVRLISSFWALWIGNEEKHHLQRTLNFSLSCKCEVSGGAFGSGFVFP